MSDSNGVISLELWLYHVISAAAPAALARDVFLSSLSKRWYQSQSNLKAASKNHPDRHSNVSKKVINHLHGFMVCTTHTNDKINVLLV